MALIVPWQPDETFRRVLAHLAAGECVVLPTESTYELVAPALDADAVARLRQTARESEAAVALGDVAELGDWLPLLCGAGARLVRKLGPGPYVLQADAGHRRGCFERLPETTKNAVCSEKRLRIRLADQPIWSELRAFGLPLISTPIAGAVDAAEAARRVGDQVSMIVDAGPARYACALALVQADGHRARLLREGAWTQQQLDELTRCRILFVCTGNTCRSPLAEALCGKLLADRLGCTPAELSAHGFSVQSAGLAASMGAPAAGEAVETAAMLGADLSRHRSCMATLDMLQWADFVFAMTAGHWHALRSVNAPNLPTPEMLSPQYEDIADPIGRALIDYQTCAQQILDCLNQRLPQILES